MAAYQQRLSSIKTLLPDEGVIGYTSVDPDRGEQAFFTQYFLAPVIVVNSTGPELVVLNGLSSQPAADHPTGSYTVAEHDGLKLYDFGTGIYLEDRRGMHHPAP
jgi:hypothetical protein